MIAERIAHDVRKEFSNLKNDLLGRVRQDFHVDEIKKSMAGRVRQEVIYKSQILLDTLLNYLMEDAQKKLKNADTDLKNAFFDADFRKRILEWTEQLENRLVMEPDTVKYTLLDPRLKQGLIASGVTFVGVGGIAVFSGVAGVVVAGMVTIVLSALAFTLAHYRATPKAREFVRRDIDRFLESSQGQILDWLGRVEESFDHDFHEFCLTNGFNWEKK